MSHCGFLLDSNERSDSMDTLRNALLDLIKSALLGFDTMIASSEDVLGRGLSSWLDVKSLADYLKPFCYILIGIFLLIEMAQVLAKVDIIKWEHGLKLCIKMVLAKVFIDIAPDFLEACYLQAAEWIHDVAGGPVGGVTTLGSLVNNQMETLVNSINGLWSILGLFISVFIVILAIKICGLVIQVMAFGRMFELYVYLAVSPVPCAFFPLGHGDGSGFSRTTEKFLKSFAAVCLQGVMMIVCIRIFGVIMTQVITDNITTVTSTSAGTVAVSDLCYTMLLGSLALVMAVVKCGSWAKAILDTV